MINIDNYPLFKMDVEGSLEDFRKIDDPKVSVTNVHPILVIHTNPPIYISQTDEMIDLFDPPFEDNLFFYHDSAQFVSANLKIPSIKESIDIENRKLKVNNVTISISNYNEDSFLLKERDLNEVGQPTGINEQYFSNLFNNYNFIGVAVDLYWKSQSCRVITDCLPIFKGAIQRISHDDSVVRMIIEDLTEAVMHKEVPSSRLSSYNAVKEGDINKVIPITYGDMQKAPCVLYKDSNLNTEEVSHYYCLPDRWDKPVKLGNLDIRDCIDGKGTKKERLEYLELESQNGLTHFVTFDEIKGLDI